MKRKLIFFFTAIALFFVSCKSTKQIPQSIWYSVTPYSINGENGYNVTSLHFLDKDLVVINGGAIEGDSVIAPAQMIATGTYKLDGKLKDGYKMTMDIETLFGDSIQYKGTISKDGIILAQPGKEALIFNLCKN